MDDIIKKSESFYDEWTQKLLIDYVRGNRRINMAINFAISEFPDNTTTVLDIGCGIGWSTHEMAVNHPNIACKGIDLSNNLIEIAKSIFYRNNLSYHRENILNPKTLLDSKFDVITLLDVYEHIPRNEQRKANKVLSDLLNNKGKIILTCPTVFHQNWLQKNKPSGLQPVDEMITYSTVKQLADDIDGYVTRFDLISVFNRFDYFHATVERANVFEEYADPLKQYIQTETFQSRVRRIHESPYSSLLDLLNIETNDNNNRTLIEKCYARIRGLF